MAETFEGKISGTFDELLDTLQQDTSFNSAVGNDFDKMTYPAAALIPSTSTYQNDLEYQDTFIILFVFEKGVKNIDLIDATEEVEAACDTIITELESDTEAKEFKPVNFDYLVAENADTRLNVISVDWEVTRTHDFTS